MLLNLRSLVGDLDEGELAGVEPNEGAVAQTSAWESREGRLRGCLRMGLRQRGQRRTRLVLPLYSDLASGFEGLDGHFGLDFMPWRRAASRRGLAGAGTGGF